MNIDSAKGFTLIELLISMVIAMILMAGLYSNFIMQSRVQNSQAQRTGSSEDVQIASQIIQRELRMSKASDLACAGNIISYTDVDGNIGSFEYQSPDNKAICWDRPNLAGGCQELIRNLDETNGMQLSLSAGTCEVTLLGNYKDREHNDRTWTTVFSVTPRN